MPMRRFGRAFFFCTYEEALVRSKTAPTLYQVRSNSVPAGAGARALECRKHRRQ
jgi:hypothetical protein